MALSALVALFFLFAGCGKEEAVTVAPDPAAPEVYMKDPAFMKQLETQRTARTALMKRRCEIEDQLAAAEKDSARGEEAKALRAKLADCDADFEKNRRETLAIVRARLAQKKNSKAK